MRNCDVELFKKYNEKETEGTWWLSVSLLSYLQTIDSILQFIRPFLQAVGLTVEQL